MSKNEFDDLLLKKVQEEDFAYKAENWERLAQLLPPEPASRGAGIKKWAVTFGIAAGLCLLLSGFLLFKLIDQQARINKTPLAGDLIKAPVQELQTPVPHKSLQTTPESDNPVSPTGRNTPVGQHDPSNTGQNQIIATQTQLNPNPNHPISNKIEQNHSTQMEEALPADPAKDISGTKRNLALTGAYSLNTAGRNKPEDKSSSAHAIAPTPPARQNEQLTQQWSAQEKDDYYKSLLEATPSEEQVSANTSRTTLGIGGGVNYGTLNTGYALGLSAKQEIGNSFFVEGSVGMLYNNNASNVANYQSALGGQNLAARPSSSTTMKLNAPAVKPVENLYYLQFNPSVGYALNNQFAVSIGGDVQQMITSNEALPKVQYTSEEVRIFPTLDFGLTGKTEFSISPEIQAGIIYREGLNSWFRSVPGTPYLNRRYIQVQFKYSLPVKK